MKRIIGFAVALLLASAMPVSAIDIEVFNHPGSNTNAWKLTDTTINKYNSSGTSIWAVDSSGNVTISGDISAAGGYKVAIVYAHQDVAVSLDSHAPIAGTVQSGASSGGTTEYVAPWSGSVIGVSFISSSALTAGDAHVDVSTGTCGSTLTKTGLIAFLGSGETETTYDSATQAKDTDTFSAGECIGLVMTTGSAFAPDNGDLTAIVVLEF
ncbi:hypothetical protein LCGC14_0337790 [marine sediment metagenome]|uniref:Uncharacterized protein n=1 Tax=marine sediment metagenome TaxID=412755 RepID=A0A0F9TEC9_9ZZZZ